MKKKSSFWEAYGRQAGNHSSMESQVYCARPLLGPVLSYIIYIIAVKNITVTFVKYFPLIYA
jgi:hypothetical protein